MEEVSDKSMEINEKVCIFCTQERKKYKSRWQNLHLLVKDTAIEHLKSNATFLNDLPMLQKIAELQSGNKLIFFHNICNVLYQNKCKEAKQTTRTDWHSTRDKHRIAFQEICAFISDNIVNKKQCYLLNSICTLYSECLKKEHEEVSNIFSTKHLQQKISDYFGKKIRIVTINNKKIVKAYEGHMLQQNDLQHLEEFDILGKAALILRNKIKKWK